MADPYFQDQDQKPMAGGAYTSGGPPQVGSTYGQYTPQSFAQQSQQQAFGGSTPAKPAATMTSWPSATQQPQQAQPQAWTQQTASWATAQPQQQAWAPQPAAQQGYGATGYSQPNQAYVQPQTAAPFGGWNTGQAQAGYQQPGNPSSAIADAYRRYLGREATPQEIAERVNQRGFDLNTHVESIARSQEAYDNYQRGQQGGPPMQGQQQGGVAARPMDPRSWNTDGYTPPRYVAQKPAGHPPPGWERAKWNDPNHQTPKYVIGRILSQFKPRTDNMDAVVAEIAKAYPGARRTGSGDVTIPGIGSTDILKAADVGGKAWHFGSTTPTKGGKPGAAPAAQPVQGGYNPYNELATVLQNYTAGQSRPIDNPIRPEGWDTNPELLAMRQQLAQFQQTQMQQQQAAEQAQRNRGPQFTYY